MTRPTKQAYLMLMAKFAASRGTCDRRQVGCVIATESGEIIGTGYIFFGLSMVMTQALNGAGDTRTPTIINVVCFWLFQIPLAYFLALYLNLKTTGVFIAIPITQAFVALIAWYYFKKGKWKQVKV